MFFKDFFFKQRHALFCLAILFVNISISQSNKTYFNELNIKGLPFNKKVNTLFEDSLGYLWIGTNTGLYQYDGYNIKEFQHNAFENYSIPNNSINSIIEDNNHNLWIGSESYLIYYNRKENKFRGFYKDITSIVLQKSSDGNIWANLRNSGLAKITPSDDIEKINLDAQFNYNRSTTLKFNKQINALIEDSFGREWIGTSAGIYILDKTKNFVLSNFKKETKEIKAFGKNQFIAITDKDLYILSYNKTNSKLEVIEQYSNILLDFGIDGGLNTFALNNNNKNVWIGSNKGLIKATRTNNKFEFSALFKGNSKGDLLNNQIRSVIFDKYDNLWIGSLKGVNKKLGRTSIFEFNQISINDALENNDASEILYYAPNCILVGMQNGLFKYNPKNKEQTKIQLPFTKINAIALSYEKDKLIIASEGNLFETEVFDPSKTKINAVKLKSFNERILDISIINKNEICVALWGEGIKFFNKQNDLSEFKMQIIKKLEKAYVSALLQTSNNELFIGTRGRGLFKANLNTEIIEEYLPSKKDGLTSNAILSLLEDSKKNIWIGTRGGGLNQYVRATNSFKHYGYSGNPFTNNTIAAIQEDSQGVLWISTQEGLLRFDVSTEKFIHFGVEDGVEEIEFLFNSSASSANKSNLYFGCTNGFYSVNSTKFIHNNKVPKTVITSFQTLGATKDDGSYSQINNAININTNSDSNIVLPYNQNNILVNFSSLDLTTPTKNNYAYMLKGLNDYWVYTTASNRNANYNDLSPGSYTFKVKSSNSDGIWNETPTELKFVIKPPFWLSYWAIAFYCLLAIAAIYIASFLIRRWYRLKKNLVKETISREKDNEHNKMKMIFFTDISHELRTPLSLILGTVEKLVKEKNFTLNPHTLQRIYNNTLRMQRLINQIMDIRKFDVGQYKLSISKNDIVKDINIIKDSFNDFARIYEIEYTFNCNEEKIVGWYDVDILEKTLFNLLSNAFKFTKEKGEISVTLEQMISNDNNGIVINLEKNKYIKCIVRDNGIGIPKKDLPFIFDRYYQATKSQKSQIPGTGIGMELVHKLIERHHGAIIVESDEHIFTEFTFYLPINKNRYKKRERINTGIPLKKHFIQNSEYKVIDEVISGFQAEVNSNNNTNPKVLIVEDNQELRQMIKEELEDEFYVVEASNGKEGYDKIVNEKPFLVISDILMPLEDGISMLKRVKGNSETSKIPVFMLTSKNSEEAKIECLSLGADDYIEKPFSLEYLKWKLKNTLSRRNELKEQYSKVITTEPSEINIDSNSDKFIKKLIKIIENSMDDNLLSVEYLASEVGMSRANLYRKLQAIINDTPVNFIKTIRLKRAAQLLKKSDMYISEIAYMTGFNNQKYFSKCFHKEYGMSPTDYVKKHGDKEKNTKIDFIN